jgi:enoyl-CoA hydratase/carnithine racemase
MSQPAFTAELEAGVLELWLDTPNCEVNIFSHQAATELEALLADIDPARVSAVVFRSRKRGSFVNGVGLMMANTVRNAEDVPRMSEAVRRAFRAVRELNVPTIAAIQGNCYGCGVEFSLHASYRVAERCFDTHFYMTELADYLFIPVFGGTQDLPRLLGLQAATRFLMWGERWSADGAQASGLIDACFDSADFEHELKRFVQSVALGVEPPRATRKRTSPEFIDRTRARIAALPDSYQPLYNDCFELMQSSITNGPNYEAEIEACARSLLQPGAKSALSLFFVRELAKATAVRRAPRQTVQRVALLDLPQLADTLRERRVRDLEVSDQPISVDLTLVPATHASSSGPRALAVARAGERPAAHAQGASYAYFPLRGIDFVELAGESTSAARAAGFDLFTRAGFRAVVSTPAPEFSSDRVLCAFFAPLRAALARGASADDIARTLRDFGFVRSAAELQALRPPNDRLTELSRAQAEPGRADPALLAALLLSLLDVALALLAEGALEHVSQLDVLAREVLDFPLAHGSLCRYLTSERAGTLLVDASAPAEALQRVRKYADDGRSLYR